MIEQFLVKKENKKKDEDEMTEGNDYDEVPLNMLRFSQGNQRTEGFRNKEFKQYDEYVEMPALQPTIIRSKKDLEETPIADTDKNKQKDKKVEKKAEKDRKQKPQIQPVKAFGLEQ